METTQAAGKTFEHTVLTECAGWRGNDLLTFLRYRNFKKDTAMGKTANNDAFIESTNWLTEGLEDETESTPVLLLDIRAVSIKNTPSIIVSIHRLD